MEPSIYLGVLVLNLTHLTYISIVSLKLMAPSQWSAILHIPLYRPCLEVKHTEGDERAFHTNMQRLIKDLQGEALLHARGVSAQIDTKTLLNGALCRAFSGVTQHHVIEHGLD
jgi:hypothetical protein